MVTTAEIEFPPCQVKGHDHELKVIREVAQQGTGNKAFVLECPTGKYRYFYIESVWCLLGQMARLDRPRWGWKD
jgi:hypothetical protein